MLNDEAAPLVLDIAKSFVSLIRGLEPEWRKAYLRFCLHDSVSDIKASYECESQVEIVDVIKHKGFFHQAAMKGSDLLAMLGKEQGVFLLVIDSNYDYDIKFEYKNLNIWTISKINGGSGLPLGLD